MPGQNATQAEPKAPLARRIREGPAAVFHACHPGTQRRQRAVTERGTSVDRQQPPQRTRHAADAIGGNRAGQRPSGLDPAPYVALFAPLQSRGAQEKGDDEEGGRLRVEEPFGAVGGVLKVAEHADAVGVEERVADPHAVRSAEGDGFRLVHRRTPAPDRPHVHRTAERFGELLFRSPGLLGEADAHPPAGPLADEPPPCDRRAAQRRQQVSAEDLLRSRVVGELDEGLVPAGAFASHIECGAAGRVVQRDRLGQPGR